jgi:hypothetical protein
MAQDRRLNIHSAGCVNLSVAGTFIHYERHSYSDKDQSYAMVGKRVYVAYDSENAALLSDSWPWLDWPTTRPKSVVWESKFE